MATRKAKLSSVRYASASKSWRSVDVYASDTRVCTYVRVQEHFWVIYLRAFSRACIMKLFVSTILNV